MNIVPSKGKRAQGKPGARRTRSLACKMIEAHEHRHHRFAGFTRPSLRNGFNGFLRALPGDRACLPPSSLRSLLLKNLMPASGHQDHTTSPSASAPFVKGAIHVHRIPPRVRDDREPPLCEAGRGELVKVICPTGKAENFSCGGWTRKLPDSPSGKSHRPVGRELQPTCPP
jgi:hypothetical protein